ncbi:hypothetical protein ARSEF1564_003919 [Beauveria bassiana]
MWTGCREHKLLYNKLKDCQKLIEEHDNESDAFSDAEPDPLTFGPRPVRKCDICGGVDERKDNLELQLLCWEDINFYILRDPSGNHGRDRLVMTVLLQWHKGHNKNVVPTWFPLVEEDIPALCPVTYILTKAIAEGVIANEGYKKRAEPFFNTKLSRKAAFIEWKPERMHKPVFRSTINALGEKSDSAQTTHIFHERSRALGKEMGLKDSLTNYCYRRGNLQTVDFHGPEPNKNHYEEILDRRSADFTEALNSRDVDGGGACYPPTSILVSKSSSTIASFGALKSAALAIL